MGASLSPPWAYDGPCREARVLCGAMLPMRHCRQRGIAANVPIGSHGPQRAAKVASSHVCNAADPRAST